MASIYGDYIYGWDTESKKHVYEHRKAAEELLGRRLKPGEVVHHKNGDKTDNTPDNLEVMLLSVHTSSHLKGKPRGYCLVCGKPQHARKLCKRHYEQRRRAGKLN